MSSYGFSDIECKIIMSQIERRAKYRMEFLKKRTDPCAHSLESGYVFDEAVQRYLSMKANQIDYFKTTPKTAFRGLMYIMPFFVYGYAIWEQRQKFLKDCRCGRIKPRDRLFKLT